MKDEDFSLYDLEVFVTGKPTTFVCSHIPGYAFRVVGENLIFDKGNQFSMYALSAILPLLPAKQRDTHPYDWMTTDAFIACPDPNCGAKIEIRRTKRTKFSHHDVTKTPLN